MKLQWFRALSLTAGCITALSIGAIAGEPSNLGLPAAQAAKGPLLFSSEYHRRKTAVVDARNHVVETLPVQPGWLAFDAKGYLYDSPFNGTDVIFVFKPPYQKPIITLGFGVYTTRGVTVDPRTNVMAVTLIDFQDGGGGSQIEFFRRGEGAPCATIQQPAQGFFVGGAAFDREGRLFALLNNGTDYLVGSISGQCRATAVDTYTLPARLNPQSYFAFNSHDDLVFQTDTYAGEVLTFAHPKNGTFAAPIATTLLQLPGSQGFTRWSFSCLSDDMHFLWAATGPDWFRPNTLSKFPYPQGGLPVASVPLHDAWNCVNDPPPLP